LRVTLEIVSKREIEGFREIDAGGAHGIAVDREEVRRLDQRLRNFCAWPERDAQPAAMLGDDDAGDVGDDEFGNGIRVEAIVVHALG
jgi:hypothetical protein